MDIEMAQMAWIIRLTPDEKHTHSPMKTPLSVRVCVCVCTYWRYKDKMRVDTGDREQEGRIEENEADSVSSVNTQAVKGAL